MLLLLSILPTGGCSGKGLSLAPPDTGEEIDYDDALDRWTRNQRLYQSFETLAVVDATYFSEEFLAAYLQEYRRVFNPLPAELEALTGKLRTRQERKECFFVSIFTGERDWNDLALANSTWKIYLENDRGDRSRSTSISQVDKSDPLFRHFFPHFRDFFEGYQVCFDRVLPQEPGAAGLPAMLLDGEVRSFSLDLRSTVGALKLAWELGS
jgi:hypothetical protein